MKNYLSDAIKKVENIKKGKLSIYDKIEIGDPKLWLTSQELSAILNEKLVGKSLQGLPLRTRSKVAKQLTCNALGFTIPNSFKKVQPRFSGLLFDTFDFQFRTNPIPSLDFDGIFYCMVLEIVPFKRLSYSWKSGPGDGKITLDSVAVWKMDAE